MCNRRWRALVLCGALMSVSATPSQGPEVKNVMREKLRLAQGILEAVVISDWVRLEANSQDLARLTSDPRWTALKYPEYAKQSAAFVRAVEALQRSCCGARLEQGAHSLCRCHAPMRGVSSVPGAPAHRSLSKAASADWESKACGRYHAPGRPVFG